MPYTAHIDRLMVFAQHGQPAGYGGSEMMRADLERLIRQVYEHPVVDESIKRRPGRSCCNEKCGWVGVTERMLGAVGPLCPVCGEVTETV